MGTRKILMVLEDDVDDRLYFCNAVKEIDAAYECLETMETNIITNYFSYQ